ncbi:MAG: hypothetical protein KGI54_12350 [Pseudomonadota bacterium]|nr:hypothetical protein [Pseudomonadota bacterium]
MSNIHPEVEPEINLHPGAIKLAMKQAQASSRDLWQVSIEHLKIIENFNVRVKGKSYLEHIRSLADSMKREGYYQNKPLAGYVVREGNKQIIYVYDGHCRLEAIRLAMSEGMELPKIPVVVSQAGVAIEDLTVALVQGNNGKPLTPYETGVVCKRLSTYGLDITTIASRIGISTQYVNELLLLMSSPTQLRQLVMDEVVSATMAIEMLMQYGERALEKILEAQKNAQAAGKERITRKHLASHSFHKLVRKSANNLYTAITEVKADPGYAGLSESTREKLEVLINKLSDAQVDTGGALSTQSNND